MARGKAREPRRPGVGALAGLALRQSLSGVLSHAGAGLWQRKLAGTPARILFAPETLAPCDAEVAADIYSGVFALAGTTVDCEGRSPFALAPPTPEWGRALHAFTWLVHLEANASALSSNNARALLDEWLGAKSAQSRMAQAPGVVAARLTAWLVESPLLLSGADSAFRLAFLRAIGRQMRRLERVTPRLAPSIEKIEAAAALALAGTVVAEQTRLQRWALSLLGEALRGQILPDGGHVSRNPEALVTILSAVVPVREALVRRQQPVPPHLGGAIDKMLPMLRFFTHDGGALASFHGARPVAPRVLAALSGFDDARGTASDNARYSGFQRMAAGDAVALFDTGLAPPPAFARAACASALALEFSHGGERIVAGCGALGTARPAWASAARATAAQSTLTLEERNSARILGLWPLTAALGPVLFGGPGTVEVAREEGGVTASHDGYLAHFGVLHRRTLSLSSDGHWLEGTDAILGQDKLAGTPFAIRFHLWPGIRVRLGRGRRNAMLRLPGGAIWLFGLDEGPQLALEDTVVLTAPDTVRRTIQIVIAGNTLTDDTIRWHIARHGEPIADPAAEKDEPS
ncbi:MAG: heparinase II/III family protein [Acuticoccus sp.]